ncbi:MAG: galactitol-1-phosphate 5-dehydrogenase [Anaerolineaceae bacterium]|nr:galactitol-1-phosphate 5-dehydrogenase [Anaerolineaceae bacterium]
MKAAILENQGVMTYKEVPTPVPAPGHVRLQVKAVSICGSDIKRYVSGHRLYPIVLGHECAGIIESVGEGVSDDLIGKHASVIPVVPCFECEQCQRGCYSACHSYSFIGSRQAGGFADFLELPERNVLVVPDELPFEHVALIEPSTVARHMLALGDFEAGQTAVVLGAGSIGLMIVQWLRILGASLIICTDVSDDNLATARKLGAHVTLNPLRDDVAAEVRRLTDDGVDISLEVAGVPQTLEQTVPITRPRGKVICGGNQPLDKSLPMSFIENMMRRELSIIGCFMSYSAPFPGHEWTETVAALLDGSLDMETMISHRYSLAETPGVFARIGDHSLTHRKIILYPEGADA